MNKAAAAAGTTLDLFPGAPQIKAGTIEQVIHIDLTEIEVDPDQPRKGADSDLEASVRQEGVIQPITVRPHPDPAKVKSGLKYMIVFGERRFIASIKAGRTTIPALIRDESEEVRRLIRQVVENKHKKLEPIEEARTFKRIQAGTGWSINQLATVLGTPKSTVGDRLALAEAPEVFQPLFVSGALSAAAAPIVRKFADVPEELLRDAVDIAKEDYRWAGPINSGGAIALQDVTAVLDRVVFTRVLKEVPERLALLYQGPTIAIGGKTYATDTPAYIAAERKWQAEQERQEREKAAATAAAAKPKKGAADDLFPVPGGSPRSSTPTPAAKPKAKPAPPAGPTPEELREREREKREAEKRRREQEQQKLEDKRWGKALPQILSATAAAVKKAPADARNALGTFVLEFVGSRSSESKAVEKVVPRGQNASDLLRHMAMMILDDTLVSLESDWNRDRNRDELIRELKACGLKIDIRKLLEAAVPTPEPAKEKGAVKGKAKPPAKKSKPAAKKKGKAKR